MKKSKKAYTQEQRLVIQSTKSVTEIIAGAGTGKTTVLCARAQYLVEQGKAPEQILVLTFTNSARKNFQERLDKLPDCKDVACLTFHAFCYRFLKWRAKSEKLTVLHKSEQKQVLTELTNQVAKSKGITAKVLRKLVNKALAKTNDDESVPLEQISAVKQVLAQLKDYKKRNGRLTYDDMVSQVAKLVQKQPKLAKQLAQKFAHLMVDELQDIGPNEMEIIKALAQQVTTTVLVGDKKQTIFGFRGADLTCWKTLDRDLKKQFEQQFKRYFLTESFRVPERILELANAVADDINDDPELSGPTTGYYTRLFTAADAEAQGKFIHQQIQCLVEHGVKPEQIAILGRTRKSLYGIKDQLAYYQHEVYESYRQSEAESEVALRALIRITRRLFQGKNQLPRKAVQRLINFLDLPENIAEDLYQKTVTEGWSEFKIAKKAVNSESIYRGVKKIHDNVIKALDLEPEAGAQLLIDALSSFIHRRFEKDKATIKHDLSRLKLRLRDYDCWDDIDLAELEFAFTDSGINLYTIHGAKGKEWDYVFVINLVDKYLPYKSTTTAKNDDEELRVFYTAITRAKQRLYLIECPILKSIFPQKKQTKKRNKLSNLLENQSPYIEQYRQFMKQASMEFMPKEFKE